jgi:hypothetical protein
LYRQYASKAWWKVLILVKQLFDKKGLFVQALSRQFKKKIDNGSKQFVKNLTAELNYKHFTSNKSGKMYTNCRHFLIVFFTQMPATNI